MTTHWISGQFGSKPFTQHYARGGLFLLALLLGCGAEALDGSDPAFTRANRSLASLEQGNKALINDASIGERGKAESSPAAADRKIIYRADVRIAVSDFAAAEDALPSLAKQHDGYLTNVSVNRSSGARRSGTWQVRVPVAQFQAFLDAVSALGVPESLEQTAQDVSEEFVDVEARIANQKRLEERILKLLEDPEGKLTDVIQVERELARVRGEVERMQGRLRYLTNRTEYTTIVVSVREEKDYVPPEAPEPPTFVERITGGFSDSLAALQETGEALVVASAIAFPWVVSVGAIIGLPTWLLRRRADQRHDQPGGEG